MLTPIATIWDELPGSLMLRCAFQKQHEWRVGCQQFTGHMVSGLFKEALFAASCCLPCVTTKQQLPSAVVVLPLF